MSFEDVRLSLLDQLDAVDSPASAMAFQQMLADELRVAETDLDPDAPWHAHLLRLIGDALAWRLLSRHTIRELARDGRRPAPLAGQGESFDFVLDVAKRIAGGGVVPIVADLTHVIGVGDIIAAASNAISIIECKNRTPPPGTLRGRHWRQQRRARSAASYLTDGHAADGQTGKTLISLDVGEPRRHDDALRDCIEQARDSVLKTAIAPLGERDFLLAVWCRELGEAAWKDALPLVDHEEWRYPVFAGSGTAVDNPGPFTMNPYTLPLPTDVRLALADCDVLLFRFVDLGLLEIEETTDRGHLTIEVYRKSGSHHLRASLDGTSLELSPRFVEQVLWDFRSVADTRSMLVETLRAIRGIGATKHGGVTAASPEVPTMASFAYRDPGGSEEPVLVGQIGQLVNLGVSVPFEELAEIAAGAGDGALRIRGVLTRHENKWVMKLDDVDGQRSGKCT